MGNPLSGILSEIYLQKFEEELMEKTQEKFKIVKWIRYVDDILCVTENNNADEILKYINKINKKIQFTKEDEQNNKINYLDVTLTKNNNKLEYSIYRKPTQTSNVIHAESTHPKQHKLAAFRSLLHRLESIPMNKTNYHKELNIIKQIADDNGYNENTIEKIHKSIKHKKTQQQNTDNRTTQQETKNWTTFTYTGKHIHRVSKLFKNENIKIAYKTTNNLKNKLKTNIEQNDIYNKSGIYKLKCNSCEKTYIGQTGRKFKDRYKEHIKSLQNMKLDSNYATHLLENHHEAGTIENIMEIIKVQPKSRKLNIMENMEIYKEKHKNNIINIQTNSTSDTIFSPLLILKTPTA